MDKQSTTITRRVWAFLNRDVRSFFPSNASPAEVSETHTAYTSRPIATCSSVDLRHLRVIEYRRALLNWRDAYIYELNNTASSRKAGFANSIDKELRNRSLRRKLFARPANEVLKSEFDYVIRSPLSTIAERATTSLQKIVIGWGVEHRVPSNVIHSFIDPSLTCIATVKFTPNKKTEILTTIDAKVIQRLVEAYSTHLCRLTDELKDKELK